MSSERYVRYMRKSLRDLEDEEQRCRHAEAGFIRNTDLPDSMASDLFYMIYDLNDRELSDGLFAKLGIVIELFQEEYDPSGSTLTLEEWEGIRDIVSENALELDERLLSYVMGLVLENDAI